MSRPGGNPTSTSLLTTRQWLQQSLPYHVTNFGPTPSRRNEPDSRFFLACWQGVPDAVDEFVRQVDDSSPRLLPFDSDLLSFRNSSEITASTLFTIVLVKVGIALGLDLDLDLNVPVRSSPGPHVGVDQRAAIFAASPNQRADLVVTVNGKQILVVEMKRPAVFRRSRGSSIPRLHPLGERVGGPSVGSHS